MIFPAKYVASEVTTIIVCETKQNLKQALFVQIILHFQKRVYMRLLRPHCKSFGHFYIYRKVLFCLKCYLDFFYLHHMFEF